MRIKYNTLSIIPYVKEAEFPRTHNGAQRLSQLSTHPLPDLRVTQTQIKMLKTAMINMTTIVASAAGRTIRSSSCCFSSGEITSPGLGVQAAGELEGGTESSVVVVFGAVSCVGSVP